ncbi:MAG: site-specific DNA-methyltransferase [Desulfobacula sp.]|nr:site-specific DNA-methyltransferase [Desulfobacula sp.]
MEKLKMHSPNFAEENIEKLSALFPGCITESTYEDGTLKKSIDFDLLRQELSTTIVEGPQERYHLNWPGKREALLTANAPIAKTLRPCREESEYFDTTENLFIEGDNLDALKLLQETYLGKVKTIYIDPPYNTGKDFIYSDNFAESTEEYLLDSGQKDEEGNRLVANTDSNGRFHSDWLSMMYSRLKLARNLLKDDGVIFISIDDGEQANLKRMCDEVFGEENFVATICWQKRYSRENRGSIGDAHEYVIVFAKQSSLFANQSGRIPLTEQQAKIYRNPNNDPKGRWRGIPMTAQGYRPNQMYEVVTPTGNVITPPEGRCWSTIESEFKKLKEAGRIYFGKANDSQPQVIRYLSEVKGLVPWTWLPHEEGGHTDESKKEMYSFFGKGFAFDTPKPTRLLERLITIGSKEKDGIILDFFAGSATTAHAVMRLNAADGGKRKFIMVQLPETCDEKSGAYEEGYTTIAEISKERIRRAGKKIKEENALTAPDLDTGFRVLKVDSGNMENVYYAPDSVEQDLLTLQTDNIKDDRTSEDLLFQVLLDWGVDLTLPITKETIKDREVFFVDGNALAACFAKNGQITENFCKELAKHQPLRVVFRDSGFKDDSIKINVEQIFKLMSPHTDVKTI